MKRILVLCAVLLLAAAGAFAQTDTDAHTVTINVAAIAAIQLDSTADIPFSTVAAGAGSPVGPDSGAPATATRRLWYTALNNATDERTITVETDVALPPGTALTVAAVTESGAGTSVGTITFSDAGATAATPIVNAIPSVATGTGGTDGTGLTYSFWVYDSDQLSVASTVITVTYTLTEDT